MFNRFNISNRPKKIFRIFLLMFFITKFHPLMAQSEKIKRAIIVVPGYMASGLFWNAKSNYLYNKGELVWLLSNSEERLLTCKNVYKFMWTYQDVALDGNGGPKDKRIGKAEFFEFPRKVDEEVYKYGVCNGYKNLIETLSNNFKNTEVKLFNYDFRLDNNVNAEFLEEEIKKYDEVILIGHSNGGVLIAKTLSGVLNKGQNLNILKGCFFIAVPFQGTLVAINAAINGENTYPTNILNVLLPYAPISRYLSRTYITTYQLMPKQVEKFIVDKNHNPIKKEEFSNIMKSKLDKDQTAQRNSIDGLSSYYDSLFVDSKFVLSTLDCPIYSILGEGFKTESSAKLTDKSFEVISHSTRGDGRVLRSSSYPPPGNDFHIPGKLKIFNALHGYLQQTSQVVNYIKNEIEKLF